MNNPFSPQGQSPGVSKKYEIPESVDALRELLFSQDRRLVLAANRLALSIRALPHDPEYPDIEPRALVVGGFVRDALIGLKPKDIDLEVYGVSADRLEDLLIQLFPGQVNLVGKAFGILKVHLADDVEFDVSIPRHESKTGKGHKGFAVVGDPGMDVKEAARRRDFTMNAIAADPLTGEIIDPFHGLDDLRSGTMRVTDAERFQDDPLRVYRALQFAGRLDLAVDQESSRLLSEMVERGDLEELPKERITEEIKKLLLKSERPSVGWELAKDLGIVAKYYPELQALVGLEQEPEWHPEGDVWTHTMMVLDAAARIVSGSESGLNQQEKLQLMLGCLCHDFGKALTTKLTDGRIRSHGHEESGTKLTLDFCDRLSFGETVVDAAVQITREHMKPNQLTQDLAKSKMDEIRFANTVRKLMKRIHPMSWKVLLVAAEADWRGRKLPGVDTEDFTPFTTFDRIIREYRLDEEPTKPLIQGRDLLGLGVKPGPLMGKIIGEIEEERDKGTLATRAEALDMAREILERP